MPFSLRFDPDTEARIRRLAKTTGRSKSAIVREAVARYEVDDAPRDGPRQSALDRVRPFIGVVATTGRFSKDTHAKFQAALRRKARARRSG